MQPSRREFVKWVTASGIALSLSRLARGAEPLIRRARDLAGTAEMESGRQLASAASTASPRSPAPSSTRRTSAPPTCPAGRRTPRTRCWSARRDATHVYTGMDLARLTGAMKPSVVVTADDLDQDRHAGAGLLCRRPVLPGRQDAALSRPAGRAADLRDLRRLRPGAARAARRHLRASSARRPARSTLPNYGAFRFTRVAGPTPDAPDVYSPLQAGWVSPGKFQNSALPVWAPLAKDTAGGLRQGRDLRRADPRRACRERPGPAGARPRVRDPVDRSDVPRAGMRPRLVRRRRATSSSWCSACSRPTRRRKSIAYLLGKARAAVQAGAHQRAVRLCRRRLRRPRPHAVPALCRAGRDVLPGQAGAARARPLPAVPGRHQAARRSRCARASASTARPARSRPSPPITCSTAAASPTSRPASRPSARPPRSASTTSRRSTSPRSRCIRAA